MRALHDPLPILAGRVLVANEPPTTTGWSMAGRESPENELNHDDPNEVARRYSKLGATGVSVSSDPRASAVSPGSPLEGWVVATALILASCLAMGIYLVVLHH
jgi:hypothetical protein